VLGVVDRERQIDAPTQRYWAFFGLEQFHRPSRHVSQYQNKNQAWWWYIEALNSFKFIVELNIIVEVKQTNTPEGRVGLLSKRRLEADRYTHLSF
jgi:hypothetical protein